MFGSSEDRGLKKLEDKIDRLERSVEALWATVVAIMIFVAGSYLAYLAAL